MNPSDFSRSIPLSFTSSAYTSSYDGCGLPTIRDLSCSVNDFPNIPPSLRRGSLPCHREYSAASTRGRCGGELVEGFFGAAFPGSLHLPWPSLSLRRSALPCSPCGANLSTLPPVRRTGIHFMLRAAGLLPFLRGIQRFSTISHPRALAACYVVAWPLPRLDFHQLAVDSFQDTPSRCYAVHCSAHPGWTLPACSSHQ
jgi:hypothetical protein